MRSSDRQLQQHHYNEIHWSHLKKDQAFSLLVYVGFLLGDLGWLLRPEVKFIPWTAILKLPVPWPRCQDISALVAKVRGRLLEITPKGPWKWGNLQEIRVVFGCVLGLLKQIQEETDRNWEMALQVILDSIGVPGSPFFPKKNLWESVGRMRLLMDNGQIWTICIQYGQPNTPGFMTLGCRRCLRSLAREASAGRQHRGDFTGCWLIVCLWSLGVKGRTTSVAMNIRRFNHVLFIRSMYFWPHF